MTDAIDRLLDWARRKRWVWSALGCLVLWVVLSVATSHFSPQSLSGILATASFLAITALGQMFVIASGGGNIDLSVGNVLTLSAYTSLIPIDGRDSHLVLGVAPTLSRLVYGRTLSAGIFSQSAATSVRPGFRVSGSNASKCSSICSRAVAPPSSA